jgi:hypothetical protein
MKLTRGQRRVLIAMLDPDCDLVYCKGGGWYCGDIPTNGKMGLGLIRLCLVSPDSWGSDNYQCYWINESGRRALEGKPPYCNAEGEYFDTLYECMASAKMQ